MQVVGDALDVQRRGRAPSANDFRSPPAQKKRPDPVSTTTFVAVGVAAPRGVGELASHGVVHPVCGVGPVQRDPGDGAGLLELDGLVFGHPWTLSPCWPLQRCPGLLVHLRVASVPPFVNHRGRHRRDTACTMGKSSDQANSGIWRSSASSTSSNRPFRRRSTGLSSVAAGGALAFAAARRRLLRHSRPRSGRPPGDAAQAHRRRRRRVAPQTARRTGRPHRGARTAGRRGRRRRAGGAARRRAGHRPRPPAGAGRADHDQPHRRRAATAPTALPSPSSATTR